MKCPTFSFPTQNCPTCQECPTSTWPTPNCPTCEECPTSTFPTQNCPTCQESTWPTPNCPTCEECTTSTCPTQLFPTHLSFTGQSPVKACVITFNLYIYIDFIVCEARREGLVHYPTTLAPDSGSVTVTAQCADNAHSITGLNVTCMHTGIWSGPVPYCQCNDGYWPVTTANGE